MEAGFQRRAIGQETVFEEDSSDTLVDGGGMKRRHPQAAPPVERDLFPINVIAGADPVDDPHEVVDAHPDDRLAHHDRRSNSGM